MRVVLVAVLLAPLAALLAPGGSSRSADETIVITPHDTQPTAARGKYNGGPFSLIVSGTFTIEYDHGAVVTYDGLYCFKGCGDKPENRSPIDFTVPDNNPIPSTWGGLWDWSNVRDVRYDASHRYELGPWNTTESNFFPELQFRISSHYTDCNNCKLRGSFSIRVVRGAVKPKDEGKLRVEFNVRASGKPTLPIRGAGSPPARVRLTASGHATFPIRSGAARLTANETKGSVTLTDGKRTLKLGIISGTTYFPATKRLVLLMKVNESNDPKCEASGFLTGARAATLTVLPVTGEPDLGTAIFVGIPVTKTIVGLGPFKLEVTPCKGYGFGWRGGDAASVRILLRETKLP